MKEKYGSYFRWGITVLTVIIASILFFFLMFWLGNIVDFIKKIFSILFPVLFGASIAYLLNPLVVILEKYLEKFFLFIRIPARAAHGLARGVAITLSLGMLLAIVSVLLSLVLPELYSSVVKLTGDLRTYANNIYAFINHHLNNSPELLSFAQDLLNNATSMLTNFVNNGLMPQMQNVMSGLTVGIIGAVKMVINLVIGIIVSVYLLVSKDRFVGQSKKLLYTLFSPDRVNVALYIFRQIDRIFGGFISGKLIDSLIIGLLCFAGMSLLKLPYVVLVSVIVGVTNVIPFFGPYIGAIPSAFLILLVNPKQCLIFVIFVLVLQQLDGNIIGPKILGDSTGLSPFWVVVSILLGGGLFGFLGMLLGVPTFAVFYFLIQTFAEYRLRKRCLPTDSLDYYNIEKIEPENGGPIYLKKDDSTKTSKKQNKNSDYNRQGLFDALTAASGKKARRGFFSETSDIGNRKTDAIPQASESEKAAPAEPPENPKN